MKVMRSCVKRSSRRSSRRKSRPNYSSITVALLAALLIAAVQFSGTAKVPKYVMLDNALERAYPAGSVTLVSEPEEYRVTDLNRFGSAIDQAFNGDYDLANTVIETSALTLSNERFVSALSRMVLEKGYVKAPPAAWGAIMVPEPNTALLLGMGITLLAGHKRRRDAI